MTTPRLFSMHPAPRIAIREWRGNVALQVGCGTVDMRPAMARAVAEDLLEAARLLDAVAAQTPALPPPEAPP